MQSAAHLAPGCHRALAAAVCIALNTEKRPLPAPGPGGGWLKVALAGGVLLCAATLSGCASTFTVAFGENARAAIAQPQCQNVGTSAQVPTLGNKTTTTTEYDDKIGFKPQVESVTEATEPAPIGPAHESRGSSLGEAFVGFFKGIGAGIRQLLPW